MFVHLLRFLGVAPRDPGKSGKREAAWAVILIASFFTAWAFWHGVEMISAATALLMALWAAALGLLGAAYKLEWDQTKKFDASAPVVSDAPPAGWPQDIAPPEKPEGDG